MLKKLLTLLLLFLGVGTTLNAEKISDYRIDVRVEQSGELAISEWITYDFQKQHKHGIFRDIPFTIKRDSRIIDIELYGFSVQMVSGAEIQGQETPDSAHKKKSDQAQIHGGTKQQYSRTPYGPNQPP